MTLSITIRGPYKGYSGHDNHVRNFVRYLTKAGVRIQLIDIPHWSPAKLSPEQREAWFESLEQPLETAIALHCCMPHQVRPLPGQRNINYTMFEASRIPRSWLTHNKRHDLVIVPTESSRQAWCTAGFPEDKLRLCPLGVDTKQFRPGLEPLDLVDSRGRRIAEYRIRILNISEIVARKNLLALMRVWIQSTHADDDAVLIIKLNHGPQSLLRFLRDLRVLEQTLGKDRSQAASVLLIDEILADAEMPRLYAAATHYWSMSCGEGWDQPMTEAGASGLQLIAPDHTAYRTYLDQTTAALIPSQRVPIPAINDADIDSLFEGVDWWQPDEDAAAAAIVNAIAGADPVNGNIRQRLSEKFSWDQAAQRLITVLQPFQAELFTPQTHPQK